MHSLCAQVHLSADNRSFSLSFHRRSPSIGVGHSYAKVIRHLKLRFFNFYYQFRTTNAMTRMIRVTPRTNGDEISRQTAKSHALKAHLRETLRVSATGPRLSINTARYKYPRRLRASSLSRKSGSLITGCCENDRVLGNDPDSETRKPRVDYTRTTVRPRIVCEGSGRNGRRGRRGRVKEMERRNHTCHPQPPPPPPPPPSLAIGGLKGSLPMELT